MSDVAYSTGYDGSDYERLLHDLGNRLLRIGGRDIVARPHISNLKDLAERGVPLTPAGVRLRPGTFKDCHANVRRLAQAGERRAYGLSLAGPFWVEHSWLVAPDGYVIETTKRMKKYFGIVSAHPVRATKSVTTRRVRKGKSR